jgi:hypothetical protein
VKIGDLVRCTPDVYGDENGVGIVLEVRYTQDTNPDYRTPPSILVYSTAGVISKYASKKYESWFDKHELELVSER